MTGSLSWQTCTSTNKLASITYQLEKFFHRIALLQILVLNPLLICQPTLAALVISPDVIEINYFRHRISCGTGLNFLHQLHGFDIDGVRFTHHCCLVIWPLLTHYKNSFHLHRHCLYCIGLHAFWGSDQFWGLGCWRDLLSTLSLDFSGHQRLGVCLNLHLLKLSQRFTLCLHFSVNSRCSHTHTVTGHNWWSVIIISFMFLPKLCLKIRRDCHSSSLCVFSKFRNILKRYCLSVVLEKGKFISTVNSINMLALHHSLSFTLTTLLKGTQFVVFLKALCDLVCSLTLLHQQFLLLQLVIQILNLLLQGLHFLAGY